MPWSRWARRPVFVDIDPATYGMDAGLLESALTKNTRAILAVHQLGFACDLPAILEDRESARIPVVEDAAVRHRQRSPRRRRMATYRSAARHRGLLSFRPRKLITCRRRRYGHHRRRIARRAPAPTAPARHDHGEYHRHDSQRVMFEPSTSRPYNCPHDRHAGCLWARPQLARLDSIIATRRALGGALSRCLGQHPMLAPPREPPGCAPTSKATLCACVQAPDVSQVEIMQHLLDRGVASRRGVGNAHAEPAYASTPWSCGPEPCDVQLHRQGRCLRLRHSEEARDQTIMIPLFHGMTEEEQEHVIEVLA